MTMAWLLVLIWSGYENDYKIGKDNQTHTEGLISIESIKGLREILVWLIAHRKLRLQCWKKYKPQSEPQSVIHKIKIKFVFS